MLVGWDLFTLTPGANPPLKPLLVGPSVSSGADVSPDGRWFAYTGKESGRSEIYVRRFDDPGAGRTQVSIDGGEEPRWSHSGREIFFRSPRAEMLVADVSAGATFSTRTPRVLFRKPSAAIDNNHRAYDLSTDDRRFLMITGKEAAVDNLVLVTNWFTELKARSAGTKR